MPKDKIIEQNCIDLLRMRGKIKSPTKEDIKELLNEIFNYERTVLSDITVNRLIRHIMNYIKDGDMNRRNADEILVLALNQLGMSNLVDEYKERVK